MTYYGGLAIIAQEEGVCMREKTILICEECLSRNYTTTKSSNVDKGRLEMKKYCKKCNKHTLHKETR